MLWIYHFVEILLRSCSLHQLQCYTLDLSLCWNFAPALPVTMAATVIHDIFFVHGMYCLPQRDSRKISFVVKKIIALSKFVAFVERLRSWISNNENSFLLFYSLLKIIVLLKNIQLVVKTKKNDCFWQSTTFILKNRGIHLHISFTKLVCFMNNCYFFTDDCGKVWYYHTFLRLKM